MTSPSSPNASNEPAPSTVWWLVRGAGRFASRYWILILVGAVAWYLFWGMEPDVDLADSGPPASDFELEQAEGGTFQLSDHDGDVVVVSLWATWCATCQQQMPGFMELHETFDDVQFVGLAIDEDGLEAVRGFLQRQSVNYPLVADRRVAAEHFNTRSTVPRTFIIDRQGEVRFEHTGKLLTGDLRPVLETLVAEPAS